MNQTVLASDGAWSSSAGPPRCELRRQLLGDQAFRSWRSPDGPLPRVIFIQPDGTRECFEARVGATVMDCAVDNGVAGIAAQCGGGCTCSTCHCFVTEPWFARVGEPEGDERDILEYVPERRPNSRLSCQIVLTDALDGIEIEVPLTDAVGRSDPDG